jgi:hypothetical protein
MKKFNIGLLHFVFLIVVALFITVSLSSCSVKDNVALNGKDLIFDKLKGLHVPKNIRLKSNTSKVDVEQFDNKETTGDFRYDNLYK